MFPFLTEKISSYPKSGFFGTKRHVVLVFILLASTACVYPNQQQERSKGFVHNAPDGDVGALRARLRDSERQFRGLPEGTKADYLDLRVQHYGQLILLLAREGVWEEQTVDAAWRAYLEIEKDGLKEHQPVLEGIGDIVSATCILQRHEEAIHWQEMAVLVSATRQPGRGFGLHKLTKLYLKAGNLKEARVCVNRALEIEGLHPGQVMRFAKWFADSNAYDDARQILRRGIDRLEDEVALAATKYDDSIVFVDSGNAVSTVFGIFGKWDPACIPIVVPKDDIEKIQEVKDRGFVDRTTAATNYYIRQAEKDANQMRALAEHALKMLKELEAATENTT